MHSRVHIHWASKETYNFLEWCPLKSTASKWMIFGLMLATVLLITHVKKQRNRNCQKWDKCLQITESQKLLPFHRRRLSNTSIAIHSNSIAGYVSIGLLYSKAIVNMITDPAIEFEWIAIEMSESLCGGKGAVSVIWNWTCDLKACISFLAHLISLFLTWVMRRTVANINPKIMHFDTADCSGHHSKKL